MTTIKTLKEVFKEFVGNELDKLKAIDLFTITDVDTLTYTCNIQRVNFKQEYKDVPILGTGLGNLTGIMKIPNVGDIVVVCFIQNSEYPIILGSLFDTISGSNDNIMPIKKGETFINGKANGAYMYINENNEVILRCSKFKVIDFEGNPLNVTGYDGTLIDLDTN